MGYSPGDHKELDMTEQLSTCTHTHIYIYSTHTYTWTYIYSFLYIAILTKAHKVFVLLLSLFYKCGNWAQRG